MLTQWEECSEERFYEALNCLPPRMQNGLGFLVGEPYSDRRCRVTGRLASTWSAFASLGHGRFAEALEALTLREFEALTRPDITAAIVPAEWPRAGVVVGGWHELVRFSAPTLAAAKRRCSEWVSENCAPEVAKHPALEIKERT